MNISVPLNRDELEQCFSLMHVLRPHLSDQARFADQIERQYNQGYVLLAAWEGKIPQGLMGYRIQENLLNGRFLYIDDLVVQPMLQRSGLGARMIQEARTIAMQQRCAHLVLDTGLHMALAQRFYFRQGLLSRAMQFFEPLSTANEARS
ncbi:GNAT family N-acetyltransferase (plasmid) [Pseudomonas luteola]|uniref:GNAT family N-acetyltransferase n=1 Tax=Pseudomonas luteola TaxID=47886 RepID=UPI003890C072